MQQTGEQVHMEAWAASAVEALEVTIAATKRSLQPKELPMPKAYWISTYRAVKDPEKLAQYAKLAGPAITAGGGQFLARGLPVKVYELGLQERKVLIEFESAAQAMATHDSPAYRAALDELGDGVDREIRIVEAA